MRFVKISKMRQHYLCDTCNVWKCMIFAIFEDHSYIMLLVCAILWGPTCAVTNLKACISYIAQPLHCYINTFRHLLVPSLQLTHSAESFNCLMLCIRWNIPFSSLYQSLPCDDNLLHHWSHITFPSTPTFPGSMVTLNLPVIAKWNLHV